MAKFRKVVIVTAKDYRDKVEEFGHMCQFSTLEVNEKCSLEGCLDSREPNKIYVMQEAVEWILNHD